MTVHTVPGGGRLRRHEQWRGLRRLRYRGLTGTPGGGGGGGTPTAWAGVAFKQGVYDGFYQGPFYFGPMSIGTATTAGGGGGNSGMLIGMAGGVTY